MVVIKGLGIVSPLGEGKAQNLAKIKQGRSAIKKVCTDLGDRLMAKIEDSILPHELNPEYVEWVDSVPRPVRFGYLAIKEAVEEAGLNQEDISSPETAFIFSSSKGDLSYLPSPGTSLMGERNKRPGIDFWRNFLPSGAATYLAGIFNLQGPQLAVVSACATGAVIIARARELLLEGKVKRVIAGASEAPLTPLLLAGYERMGVLSHSMMRPFDRRRDGFALGEGAVCLVLEKEGSGIGKILGCSLGSGGGSPYRFNPDADVMAHLLKEITIKKNLFPHYINTHGTATVFGDIYETIQIKKAFGKDASRIPVSSTKSMTGHLIGVSGLLEFALTLLCLRDGFIPGTFGLEEKDPCCDLDYIKDNIPGSLRRFLITSYGFGGAIACISGEI